MSRWRKGQNRQGVKWSDGQALCVNVSYSVVLRQIFEQAVIEAHPISHEAKKLSNLLSKATHPSTPFRRDLTFWHLLARYTRVTSVTSGFPKILRAGLVNTEFSS